VLSQVIQFAAESKDDAAKSRRLSQFVPPPATVTKEGILRLDQPMLDLWWNELGFDDISVRRHWEACGLLAVGRQDA
jgi:hypothetical protein